MLSKLIGYEFYATRRVYLPAFLAVIVLAVLNAVLMATVWNVDTFSAPAGIVLTLYVLALFAIWVMALIYMIHRFHRNLLCDEGYLMFTLPAKPSQLIWAKAIASVIWMVLTAIVCFASLCIVVTPLMVVNVQDVSWGLFGRDLSSLLSIVWHDYGMALIIVPLEAIVFALLCILQSVPPSPHRVGVWRVCCLRCGTADSQSAVPELAGQQRHSISEGGFGAVRGHADVSGSAWHDFGTGGIERRLLWNYELHFEQTTEFTIMAAAQRQRGRVS